GGLFGGGFAGAPPVGHGGAPESWRCQLPDGAVVRDAAPLFDGSRIGLVAELADGKHAFVVATRDGEVQRTLACPGDAARLVPTRSQIAIADRERIALIDLSSGRTAAEWPVQSPVLEIAVSHDAAHAVLAHADGIAEVVVAEVSTVRSAP